MSSETPSQSAGIVRRARRSSPVLRRLASLALAAALAAVVLLALLLVVVPAALGAQSYTVLTGSMRPALEPGHLIGVRPVPIGDIRPGDIVTYQIASGRPEVATHRVVGVVMSSAGERLLLTQGDANDVRDADPVREVQVRGMVVYAVPWIGHLSLWATPAVKSATVTILGALAVGYGVLVLLRPARAHRRGGGSWSGPSRRRGSARPDGTAPQRARRPTTTGAAVLLVTAPVAVLGWAVPARAEAAVPEIGFDGSEWSTELVLDLFGADGLIVPGDVIERTFWLRNSSPDTARSTVTAAVRPAEPGHPAHEALAADLMVSLDGTAVALGEEWHGIPLRPGEAHLVRVRVELPVGATSLDSRGGVSQVSLDVALSRDGPADDSPTFDGPSHEDPPHGDDSARLPSTGAGSGVLLAVASAFLVVAGVLVRRARRA